MYEKLMTCLESVREDRVEVSVRTTHRYLVTRFQRENVR